MTQKPNSKKSSTSLTQQQELKATSLNFATKLGSGINKRRKHDLGREPKLLGFLSEEQKQNIKKEGNDSTADASSQNESSVVSPSTSGTPLPDSAFRIPKPIGNVFLTRSITSWNQQQGGTETDACLYDTSHGLLYNADLVYTLHRKFHLLGTLIGLHPKHHTQTHTFSLPYMLSAYALRLALEMNILRPVFCENLIGMEYRESEAVSTEASSEEKQDTSSAVPQVENDADKGPETDTESNTTTSHPSKNSDHNLKQQLSEIFQVGSYDTPVEAYLTEEQVKLHQVSLSELKWNPNHKHKYLVYKDLWKRGFFMTGGMKFGVDWLLYDDDPVLLHARFMLYIVSWDQYLSPQTMNAMMRLAVTVKKTILMASVDEDSVVRYMEYKYYSMKKQINWIQKSMQRQKDSSSSVKVSPNADPQASRKRARSDPTTTTGAAESGSEPPSKKPRIQR